MPEGTTITCIHAIFFPFAPQSLISYQDVCTNSFHLSTKILNRQEALVFIQNNKAVKTTFVATSGLYWIAIQPPVVSSFALSYKDNKVFFGIEDWAIQALHHSGKLFHTLLDRICN